MFFQPRNWRFFLTKVEQYFKRKWVDVLAYCLMPNHYHLLVAVKVHDVLSSKIMQPFGTSYVKAINKQEGRVGPLFQGRFRGKHVQSTHYLPHLSRHIHLNPVRAGIVNRPEEWPYSSYLDYLGQQSVTFVNTGRILAQFESPQAYQSFVEDEVDARHSELLLRPYLFDE
ncbi:MAG: transposase [Ardenticatenaceae bacterium]|nr:transposase [Ardenticatenaceae bacterium]